MTEQLRIADDLALPAQAVTETFGILAKRGSGKSYAAAVLAEEMLGAGMQVVIIDALDVFWGLRSSANGERPGLPIVIIGGSHGDLPLDAHAGHALADAVVEDRFSCVLSLRHLSKGDQRRFVTDFCEQLYQRKGDPEYRAPLHLIIDEADSYVPQRVFSGQERMVGAIDDLVRRGRSSGIGVTLITQRAAVISKDVLTQIETLIVLRTISPQDRKALEAWVDAHDVEGRRHEFMASLASLPIGTAWFWSPGWLDIFQRVAVRRRNTFDSSATPKLGEEREAPRALAEIDLEALRQRMAETIERAKQDDPRELRRRIAELERQLASRPAETITETVVERVEVPVAGLNAEQRDRIEDALDRLHEVVLAIPTAEPQAPAPPAEPPPPALQVVRSHGGSKRPTDQGTKLRAGERAILAVAARHHPLRITRAQLATLSRFTPSGGTYSGYYRNLRRLGYLEEQDGQVGITTAGLDSLGAERPRAPQTTAEVQELWKKALRLGERIMLEELIKAYPKTMSRQDLASRSGYAASGGTFTGYLGTLRRNGLIIEHNGLIGASEVLFLADRQQRNGA